jgi:hypothetical protein
MPGPDGVLLDGRAARADEDLDARGCLAGGDRRALAGRERRVELDGRERVQGHGDDRRAGGDRVAVAQVHLHA